MSRTPASEMSVQRKRSIGRIVCAAELCCAVGNTPLISTRAPLILKYVTATTRSGTSPNILLKFDESCWFEQVLRGLLCSRGVAAPGQAHGEHVLLCRGC